MNARLSSATSLIFHVAFLAMMSLITSRSPKTVPRPEVMEIEITDFQEVRPLPEPVIVTDSDVNESLTEAPRFTPADAGNPKQTDGPAPRHEPAPQPLLPVPQYPVPAPLPPVAKPSPKAAATPALAPAPLKPVTPVPASVEVPTDPELAKLASAPSPSPAPAPPARRLDTLALSQSLTAKTSTAPASRLNSTTIGSAIGRAVPKGAAGLTVRQRANLVAMIRSQITPCWNPPVAEENSGHVTVVMRIRLDRSGSVAGTPSVSRLTGRTAANTAYANALSGSVRRAVLKCSPLKLPAELYDAWSNVELNFDPKDV